MIEFIKINTKAGEMIACSVEEGICLLEFSYRRSLPKELDYLREYFKSEIIEAENQHLIELRQQLEEYFEVEIADDGVSAIKMVKLKGISYFDVILLDINMVNMGGFEASKIIRTLIDKYGRNKAKIYFLSGDKT